MWLQRDGDSLQQWLHVSKYPPSLSYAALELGLMALGIAALMGLAWRVTIRASGPILLFGQTALFFYIAHFTLLGISKPLLGVERGSLERVYVAAAVVLLVLYPCCLWFRNFKRARPDDWVRFIWGMSASRRRHQRPGNMVSTSGLLAMGWLRFQRFQR